MTSSQHPLAATAPAEPPAAPESGTTAVMIRIWQEVLNCSQVDPGDSFFALGGDSILLMEMLFRVREALGVEVPSEAVFATPALRDVCALVDELGPSA